MASGSSWFSNLISAVGPALHARLTSIASNPNVQAATADAIKMAVDGMLQHKNDPAKQQQVGDALKANADKIVGAVFAKTPVATQVDPAILPPSEGAG